MRIFNAEKTLELTEYDLAKGKLVPDKLLIAHHEKTEGREEVGHYETVAEYPNGGKDVVWVVDTPAVLACEAHDEYEEILVYLPFTEKEQKAFLRFKRKTLLEAFDKWEKGVLRGRETEDPAIMDWYFAVLNLESAAFDAIPERVKYYF